MQTVKKYLSLALVLAMVLSCLPMQAWAEETEAEVVELPALEATVEKEAMAASNDDLTWVLTSDGVLTISGTGSMSYEIPWKSYAAQITKVVIEEGVTSIASSAFYECYSLKEVVLPDSLTSIDYSAFYKCNALTSFPIPSGVKNISIDAFNQCTSLEKFIVDENNATYASDDRGVLFNKEMTTLLLAPDGISGSYTVPDGVTEIDQSAFYLSKKLTEVTVSDTVKVIDYSAFGSCTALTSVHLPEGLESIGNSAFSSCTALSSIQIPSTVTKVGEYMFSNCDALTEVTVPGNVVSVSNSMFTGCDGLVEVTIEKGIVSIGKSAFSDCDKLENVSIPRTVTAIGESAFRWCYALKSVVIPENVSYIDNAAFDYCNKLQEIRFEGNAPTFGTNCFSGVNAAVYYPAGDDTWTQEIRDASYGSSSTLIWISYEKTETPEEDEEIYILGSGTSGDLTWVVTSDGVLTISGTGSMSYEIPWKSYAAQITKVVIEEGVTSIASSAFYECYSLKEVVLPDSLTSIDYSAFYKCNALTSFPIPSGVKNISIDAFNQCTSLEKFIVDENNATYASDDRGVLFNKEMTTLLLAPDGISGSYTVPDGVAEIDRNAFYLSKKLTEVTVSDTVKVIDYSAFGSCTALTTVHLPEGLESIGNSAFSSCTALSSIEIPSTVTMVGEYMLSNCDALTEVTVPGNVVSVSNSMFTGCDGLVEVTIEKGIVSIGKSAFSDCDKLENVSIPRTVTAIGESAFRWCYALKSVVIPENVSYIDNAAFDYCSKLQEIRFEGNAPGFGTNCFSGVNAAVYYPAGDDTWTQEIRDASYGSSSTLIWLSYEKTETPEEDEEIYILGSGTSGDLTWVVTSDGVLTISGTGSMNYEIPWKPYAAMITKVVIEEGVTSIASSAFYECYSLKEVVLPDSLISIDYSAFYKCIRLPQIVIPSGVKNISIDAFNQCTSLEKFIVDENNATYASDDRGVLFNKEMTTLILAPDGISGSYTVPDGVTEIDQSAFYLSKKLAEAIVSDTVKVIDYSAFGSCTALTSVHLPEGLESIGNSAFSSCTALSGIQIPSTVTMVGEYMLSNCDALTEVTVPGNVVSVSNSMFTGCDGLVEVTIEKGIVSIGKSAFSDCDKLENVSIPRTVTAIGESAFRWCYALKSVVIPENVSYIDNAAFDYCNKLQEIRFEGNAPTFGTNCFSGVNAAVYYPAGDDTWTQEIRDASYGSSSTLIWISYEKTETPEEDEEVYVVAWGYCGKNVTWQLTSDGVLLISGSGAMEFSAAKSGSETTAPWSAYADQIQKVIVESGVTTIADGAFTDCRNLTEVTFCGDMPEMGAECFGSGSVTVYYPGGNDTWTREALEELRGVVDLVPNVPAGDFTNNLIVDEDDVIYLLWHTLFSEDYPIDINGDINGDGNVDEDDVIYLLWFTLFPEDYPL